MQSEEIPKLGASLEVETLGTFKVPFDKAYALQEHIAEGAFGSVHRAHHLSSKPDEIVAVKIMSRDYSNDEETAIEEASILRQLKDVPNVIKLIDFYMDRKNMYSVQVLAEGGDVFDRLVEKTVFTEKNAHDFAQTLIRTIGDMHSLGIVHRDIKPENILLRDNSSDTEILLCDFDLAKQLDGDDLDNSGMFTYCGTPAYTAPEILEGFEYGRMVDVWSAGCVLFFLLGGYLPFGEDAGQDLSNRITTGDFDFEDECWNVVSQDAKDLISNMLKVDPKERWTAKQALQCDWFTKSSALKLRQSNLWRSQKKIQNYIARRKFKAAVRAVELSNSLTELNFENEDTERTMTDTDLEAENELDLAQKYSAKKKFKAAVLAVEFSNSLKDCHFDFEETERTLSETEVEVETDLDLETYAKAVPLSPTIFSKSILERQDKFFQQERDRKSYIPLETEAESKPAIERMNGCRNIFG